MSEPDGRITVKLDGDDIKHLISRGTSTVTKDVGPLSVRIKCRGRVYSKFVLDDVPEDQAGEIDL